MIYHVTVTDFTPWSPCGFLSIMGADVVTHWGTELCRQAWCCPHKLPRWSRNQLFHLNKKTFLRLRASSEFLFHMYWVCWTPFLGSFLFSHNSYFCVSRNFSSLSSCSLPVTPSHWLRCSLMTPIVNLATTPFVLETPFPFRPVLHPWLSALFRCAVLTVP